jgi:hypothetical protein
VIGSSLAWLLNKVLVFFCYFWFSHFRVRLIGDCCTGVATFRGSIRAFSCVFYVFKKKKGKKRKKERMCAEAQKRRSSLIATPLFFGVSLSF